MSITLIYLLYALIGAFGGILGGLLGIGGGIISVPCLLFIFPYLDIPQAYIMHAAVGTSLAAMVLNTAASSLAHHKRKGVLWHVFLRLIPGLIIGSFLGALISVWLNDTVLEIFFGIFLIALSIRFYIQKPIHAEGHHLPHPLILNAFSLCIGTISNLLGIGGGSMTVPLLTSFKIPDKNAIGTSAATTFVTTICGTVAYLILGRGDIPSADTIGLINIPAAAIIGGFAFLTAPFGAKLTHEINPTKVRKIFAIVLALTGLSLIVY